MLSKEHDVVTPVAAKDALRSAGGEKSISSCDR
jgi:hypothetical protein